MKTLIILMALFLVSCADSSSSQVQDGETQAYSYVLTQASSDLMELGEPPVSFSSMKVFLTSKTSHTCAGDNIYIPRSYSSQQAQASIYQMIGACKFMLPIQMRYGLMDFNLLDSVAFIEFQRSKQDRLALIKMVIDDAKQNGTY